MRVKGVRRKNQWIKYRISEATEQTDGKHNQKRETTVEMTARCAKPSRCWARRGQRWAQHNVRKDEDETKVGRGGGGFKLDEAKSARRKQRQNRQYNYEQTRSTRHSGRPANPNGSCTGASREILSGRHCTWCFLVFFHERKLAEPTLVSLRHVLCNAVWGLLPGEFKIYLSSPHPDKMVKQPWLFIAAFLLQDQTFRRARWSTGLYRGYTCSADRTNPCCKNWLQYLQPGSGFTGWQDSWKLPPTKWISKQTFCVNTAFPQLLLFLQRLGLPWLDCHPWMQTVKPWRWQGSLRSWQWRETAKDGFVPSSLGKCDFTKPRRTWQCLVVTVVAEIGLRKERHPWLQNVDIRMTSP